MTTIYIGPYLVIPPSTVKSVTKQRACSANCSAPAVSKPAKFCGNCGAPVVKHDVPQDTVKPISIYALDGKWTDFMFCPEHGQHHPKGDVWIPNQGKNGVWLDRGAEDHQQPIPLSNLDGQAMLLKAQAQYADFVAALNADFGIEPTWEVGVIAYA